MNKYNISISCTELHSWKQKPAEHHVQVYKNDTNTIMERNGAPRYVWLYDILLWLVHLTS